MRRIRKEIEKYNNISSDTYDSLIESTGYNTVHFTIHIKPIVKNVKVCLKYSSEYPFTPPDMYINGNRYLLLLKTNKFNKDILKKIYKNNCCLCCTTIMCRNNWAPTLNFKNILDEIVKNLILKTYFVSVFNANKIYQNYNISDDILNKIIKYL